MAADMLHSPAFFFIAEFTEDFSRKDEDFNYCNPTFSIQFVLKKVAFVL